jgi:hypothetical protein
LSSKESFKQSFDLGIRTKITKVINVEANVDRGRTRSETAMENTRIMGRSSETHGLEDARDLVKLMAGGTTKAIERFSETPEGVRFGTWTSFLRRPDNGDLIIRKGGLTEGVLAITLFETTLVLDSNTSEDA